MAIAGQEREVVVDGDDAVDLDGAALALADDEQIVEVVQPEGVNVLTVGFNPFTISSVVGIKKETAMNDLQVTLTADERTFLVAFLENALKDKRVEEHRTRKPSYREHLAHEEDIMAGLLKKLGAAK